MNKRLKAQEQYYKTFQKLVRKQGLTLNHIDFRRPVITEKAGFWKKLFGSYDYEHPQIVAVIESETARGNIAGNIDIGFNHKGKILGYKRDYHGLEMSLVDEKYKEQFIEIVLQMENFLREPVLDNYPDQKKSELLIAVANQNPIYEYGVDYTSETLRKTPKLREIAQLQF